jgi:hypothetical protein
MRKLAVQGAPSICIADITVEQPGHGFFEVLCNQFEATTDCSTQAEALFVENVSNRRFATWLKCRGFLQCPYSDPALPTLYLTCPRPFRNR